MSFKVKRSTHGNTARSSIRRSIRRTLKSNKHTRLKDPDRFLSPDSDEEAIVDELFIKRASIQEVTSRVRGLFRKEYLYKLHVQWNIAKIGVIYRSYDDFFRLQMRLLDYFGENAASSTSRTIPFLPGRHFLSLNTRSNAEKRAPGIQEYVKELLDLPIQVSRCNEVLNFFKYRKNDPQEIVVELPETLVAPKPPRNENFVRSSIRRSYKRVRKAVVRTGSLRSMTEEEKKRENNANYDVEPTTADLGGAVLESSSSSDDDSCSDNDADGDTGKRKKPGVFSDPF